MITVGFWVAGSTPLAEDTLSVAAADVLVVTGDDALRIEYLSFPLPLLLAWQKVDDLRLAGVAVARIPMRLQRPQVRTAVPVTVLVVLVENICKNEIIINQIIDIRDQKRRI